MKWIGKIAVVFVLIFAMGGCAWFQPKEEETARQLAQRGMQALEDHRYDQAVEAFEKLKDWYPFSEYASLAELKLGDAHYYRKAYEEAIFAYEQFESLHPKNEAVPYVVYQIGRCYFDRLQSFDRDQTMAKEAVKAFERLVRSHPESRFAEKAKAHIRVCQRNLAEHEFYVGLFYYKSEHYKAAMERFKTVVKTYPDLGVHYRAIQYIALCRSKLANVESGSS